MDGKESRSRRDEARVQHRRYGPLAQGSGRGNPHDHRGNGREKSEQQRKPRQQVKTGGAVAAAGDHERVVRPHLGQGCEADGPAQKVPPALSVTCYLKDVADLPLLAYSRPGVCRGTWCTVLTTCCELARSGLREASSDLVQVLIEQLHPTEVVLVSFGVYHPAVPELSAIAQSSVYHAKCDGVRKWENHFSFLDIMKNDEITREPLAKLFRIPWSRRVRLVPTRPFLQQKPSTLVNSLILSVFRHCLDAPLLLMSFSNDVFRNPGQVASLIS